MKLLCSWMIRAHCHKAIKCVKRSERASEASAKKGLSGGTPRVTPPAGERKVQAKRAQREGCRVGPPGYPLWPARCPSPPLQPLTLPRPIR
jgi:hypothetical protein